MSIAAGIGGVARAASLRGATRAERTAAGQTPLVVGRARAALTSTRSVLTVVPSPQPEPKRHRVPFAAAVISLLVAGLIGLLVLNTVLGKDAFALHALQVERRALQDREQALAREVEALRAPGALAAKASALGMVQAGPPAFLRLPDGAVLGSAEPALAPPVPAPGGPAPLGDDAIPADVLAATGPADAAAAADDDETDAAEPDDAAAADPDGAAAPGEG